MCFLIEIIDWCDEFFKLSLMYQNQLHDHHKKINILLNNKYFNNIINVKITKIKYFLKQQI